MQKRNLFHRLQRKRYSKGAYKNPYFHAPKKPSKYYFFITILALVGACSLVLYFLLSPTFSLNQIEISGMSGEDTLKDSIHSYLEKRHWLFVQNANMFLFSKENLASHLAKTYSFEELIIQKNNRSLLIQVKERTADFIWKTGVQTFLIDKNGHIIIQLGEEGSPQNLPLILDRTNTPVSVGDSVLTASTLSQLKTFMRFLKDQGIETKEVQIDQETGMWIGIVTTVGYKILFDPDGDLHFQSESLKALFKETIKDQTKLEYIDLRFPDRAYYK